MFSVPKGEHPASRDADTIARKPPVSIARSGGGAMPACAWRHRMRGMVEAAAGGRFRVCRSLFTGEGKNRLQAGSYTKPSRIFPSSEIMDWFHGGSHTRRTSAELTPGTSTILLRASSAMAGPMPQPGAVSVINTFTR